MMERRKKEFFENGFLYFPDFFSKDLISSFLNSVNQIECSNFESRILEPDGQTVRSIFNLQTLAPDLIEGIRSTDLVEVAESLLQSKTYVHQFHINYKHPVKGSDYAWHSDFTFWYWEDGMKKPQALSFVIPLEEHTPVNGGLEVIKGSHKTYYQKEWYRKSRNPLSEVKHSYQENPKVAGLVPPEELAKISSDNFIPLYMKAGDLFVMHANLWHQSIENESNSSRKSLFFILNSIENQLGQPKSGQPPRPDFISSRNPLPF